MKSEGLSLAQGLMAAPRISRSSSGTISAPPSRGFPDPDRILPSMSLDTGIFMVSPRKRTDASLSIPEVPSNTWTTTMSPEESRTWPLLMEPSESLMLTISLYPTGSVFFTYTRGPAIWEIVLYSLEMSAMIITLQAPRTGRPCPRRLRQAPRPRCPRTWPG